MFTCRHFDLLTLFWGNVRLIKMLKNGLVLFAYVFKNT